MEPLLSTADAAELLRVAPASVKRWADAGELPCVRTAGRHRRFRAEDVERFRAKLSATPSRGWAEGWVDFLVEGNDPHRVQARLLTERAVRGSWLAAADALVAVIEELGVRWERGDLSVYEEHLASERLARGLARCAEAIPLAANAPVAFLAAVDEEEHTLGLSLAELVFREAGIATLWTGRRTPTKDVSLAMAAGDADIVALTASALRDAKALARAARAIGASGLRSGVPVLLGGGGPWPEKPLPGTSRVRSFADLAEWVRERPKTS